MQRKPLIDFLRAFAIVLMFFFHLCYDLTLFNYLQIDFFHDPFWFYLPRLIVTLFLVSSAAGLVYSYQIRIDWQKFSWRFGKIALSAIAITAITYLVFPQNWVIFGTLHCIALTSLIALPFLKHPKISGVLAIASLFLALGLGYNTQYFSQLFSFKSMDFIPPFPWMGWVWAGIFLAHTQLFQRQIFNPKLNKITHFLSKHSLKIYLIHQPFLYGVIWLVYHCQRS